MSGENVELVRRAIEAYNRRDLDGWLEEWAPDVVVDWSNARSFDAGVYRGHEEIRALANGFLSAFDEVRFELVDPVEVEEGVLITENATARCPGMPGFMNRLTPSKPPGLREEAKLLLCARSRSPIPGWHLELLSDQATRRW